MTDAPAQYETEDPVISIGVLARRVGLSVSAVRRYENEGLIIAHRMGSGHRLFSHEDIDRVRHIRHMIADLGLNFEGIRRMQALLPCWDLLPCSAEDRTSCPACRDSARPCWMHKKLRCAPRGDECRDCVVYRFGSLCTQDVKHLLHDENGFEDTGAAIQGLLQRKRRSKMKES